jgi:hypothetical protein
VSNDKNIEVNVVISQKNLSCTIFDKKKWQETEWTKILRTDSVNTVHELNNTVQDGLHDLDKTVHDELHDIKNTVQDGLHDLDKTVHELNNTVQDGLLDQTILMYLIFTILLFLMYWENLEFSWSIPLKGTCIGHLGARDDQTIRISTCLQKNN